MDNKFLNRQTLEGIDGRKRYKSCELLKVNLSRISVKQGSFVRQQHNSSIY